MITVTELIKHLQTLPPDAVVMLEVDENLEPARFASVNKQPFYIRKSDLTVHPEDCLWFELHNMEGLEDAIYTELKTKHGINSPEANEHLEYCGFELIANNPVIITN